MAVLLTHRGDPNAPLVTKPEAVIFGAWYQAIRASLWAQLDSAHPLDDGYRLVFRSAIEARAYQDATADKTGTDLQAFIQLEAQRCPFLSFSLSQAGTFFSLTITGPTGTMAWLKDEYELAD